MLLLSKVLFVIALVCFALSALGVDGVPGNTGKALRLLPLGLFCWSGAVFVATL